MGDAPLTVKSRNSIASALSRAVTNAARTRWLVVLCVVIAPAVLPGTSSATPIRTAKGKLLSCPDPSVVTADVGRYRYYLACTSDRQANAFPIRGSNDLVHWTMVSYVFPAHKQPWWALKTPKGRYWAPAIYRIDGRWVVYFAAEYNAKAIRLRLPGGQRIPSGTMVIGAASANSLSGPWHTEIIHFRGQFNGLRGEQERYGGVIDPSMVQNPLTGQRYLFWAEQHSSIWASALSSDGLTLGVRIHQVLWTKPSSWECDTPNHRCTIEGPEEAYRNGVFYLFYSGASTWSGTYAVGVAAALDPVRGVFTRLGAQPILRSGHGWLGPGGTSGPVVAPDGAEEIFYHAERASNPTHDSADRYLFSGPLDWEGVTDSDPIINQGEAGIAFPPS